MGPAGPWIVATHSIPWPSGGTIKISAITAPRSQVNLQECFALKDRPTICKGRLPVDLQLSTPDVNRQATTTD